MYTASIAAAEEIQLLLPDNQPEGATQVGVATLLGLGLLAIAIPTCWLRLRSDRAPA